MTTIAVLERIDTSLRDKLISRLAMRWPQAAAYTPMDSIRVIYGRPLPEPDQALLDMYVLAYQDAIMDILDMLDKSGTRPGPPYALRQAENSIFQGGTPPPGPRKGNRDARHPGGRDPAHQDSEARRRLEELFSGGGK